MRTVKVFKYEKILGQINYEKVEDGTAKFHQWGVGFDVFETGIGNFTTAIIERDDGTVESVDAEMIQFV